MLRPVCSGDPDELVLQCLEPRFGVDDRLEVAFEDPAVVDRLGVGDLIAQCHRILERFPALVAERDP